MFTTRQLGLISLALLGGLILAGGYAAYYYQEYQSLSQSYGQLVKTVNGVTYTTNVLFDFGNGTRVWFNSTRVPVGWNLYNVTSYLTHGNINVTYYQQYKAHLFNGIEGVQNTKNKSWFLWTYSSSWQTAQTGSDELRVFDGSVYAWTFCESDSNFNPTCRP